MPAFEQQTRTEKPAGEQHARDANSLQTEYANSVKSMATKIEKGQLSSDDTKNAVSLTFHNIYEAAGGGANGRQAEDRLVDALNDQLRADGSQAHMDKISAGMFGSPNKNSYAITDASRGPGSSGIITPEMTSETTKPSDRTQMQTESGDKVADVKPAVDNTPKLSDTPAYNRAGEDAALAIMSKTMSPEQKAEAVLNAMNKAGVKNSDGAVNFDEVLNKKLGKVGTASGVWNRSMFAAAFKGAIEIKTSAGEDITVPFVTDNGKLVAPPKDN